jgi:hypothetical protein
MASRPRLPGPLNHHPSSSPRCETQDASESPDRATTLPRASTSDSRPQSPSIPIRSRAASSASSTYSSPSTSVRRKPLPLSTSHLVTGSSSSELLATTFEIPEDVFARQYASDSPTLYEFPSTSTVPFTPASSANRASKYVVDPSLIPPCKVYHSMWRTNVVHQTFGQALSCDSRRFVARARYSFRPKHPKKHNPSRSVANSYLTGSRTKACAANQ